MTEQELHFHKILSAIDATVSLIITGGILLYFMGIWKGALNLCVPLLSVSMLTSCLRFWKRNRTVSIICLCAAVFILACCAGVFLI